MKLILEFMITVILLTIAWHDKKTRRIPDFILAILGVMGMMFRCVTGTSNWESYIIGVFGVSILLMAVSSIKPGSFGGGDVKLMAVSGLILGWERNLYALFWGMTAASVYCMCMMTARRIGWRSKIALGPFLCAGIIWEFLSYETGIWRFF